MSFKKRLRNWLNSNDDKDQVLSGTYKCREMQFNDGDGVVELKIYSAENGKILQFLKYDRHTDRYITTNYIIDKNSDISEVLPKYVKMELLK